MSSNLSRCYLERLLQIAFSKWHGVNPPLLCNNTNYPNLNDIILIILVQLMGSKIGGIVTK